MVLGETTPRTHRQIERAVDQDSLIHREYVHAEGHMTVFIHTPIFFVSLLAEILKGIGYWGSADSFTSYADMHLGEPPEGETVLPLRQVKPATPLKGYFVHFATEFQTRGIGWEEVMPNHSSSEDFLDVELYAWPLMVTERHGGGKLLARRSLL